MSRRALACTTAIIAILGAATACKPATTTGSSGSTATATATAGSNDSKATTKKTVPNFIGMGLQSAQDTAQKQGFYSLTSHDSSGRARMQILDRQRKVCSQTVSYTHSTRPTK